MQQLGELALFWSSWHVSPSVAVVLSTSVPFSAVAASSCQNVTVEAKEAKAIRYTHTKNPPRFHLTTAWIIVILFFLPRPLACLNALLALLALIGLPTETAGHWEHQNVTVPLWLTSLLGNMCYEMSLYNQKTSLLYSSEEHTDKNPRLHRAPSPGVASVPLFLSDSKTGHSTSSAVSQGGLA